MFQTSPSGSDLLSSPVLSPYTYGCSRSSSSIGESSSYELDFAYKNPPDRTLSSGSSTDLLSLGKHMVSKCIERTYSSTASLISASASSSSQEEHVGTSSANETSSPSSPSTPPSSTWFRLFFVFLISLKMQLLFEHTICFLSLIAARHLAVASRKRTCSNSHTKDDPSESEPELEVESEDSKCTTTSSESENSSCSSCDRQSTSKLSRTASSLSSRSSQTWSSTTTCESSSTTSALSSVSTPDAISDMNENADDWGQFAEFDDDDDDHHEPIVTLSLDDPFQSINKSMMKMRGAKVSICKLERLQEGDEEDEEEPDW